MRRSTLTIPVFVALTMSATFFADASTTHSSTTKPSPSVKTSQQAGGAGMMGGMSMDQMMQMMETMHPAIAVDDKYVYIVRGSEVIKLNKNTLELVTEAMLPAMQMGSMQASVGGGPGRGPDLQGMAQMPSVQFEQSFLQNMIHHHAGAVAMSQPVVQRAVHPELRKFARNVIDTQSQQNREMSVWLQSWYGISASTSPMPMDIQIASQLRGLQGRDLEIQYMQSMITHHNNGINMARMAEQKAIHPELKALASNIVMAQTAEVNQLRNWLQAWYNIKA